LRCAYGSQVRPWSTSVPVRARRQPCLVHCGSIAPTDGVAGAVTLLHVHTRTRAILVWPGIARPSDVERMCTSTRSHRYPNSALLVGSRRNPNSLAVKRFTHSRMKRGTEAKKRSVRYRVLWDSPDVTEPQQPAGGLGKDVLPKVVVLSAVCCIVAPVSSQRAALAQVNHNQRSTPPFVSSLCDSYRFLPLFARMPCGRTKFLIPFFSSPGY
jgi:hypothetical protein